MPPQLSKGQRAAQRNTEKRKAKFAAAEAAKAPEDRIINRTDFDDFICRQLCAAREASMLSMRQWFKDFAIDDNIRLRPDGEIAAAFFTRGGPAFTTKVMRMFIEYLLGSRTGVIPEGGGLLHIVTLHNYVELLVATAKRAQNPIHRSVSGEAHAWIDFHLVPRKLVNTISRSKEMTLPQDVTTILRILFSVDYMAKFPNTRDVLYLSLFINMAVDCSGRASELIPRTKQDKDRCFRWRHVWAYAFATPNGPTIKAKAQFKDLKSQKPDPSKHKTIPLRFLPGELATEDTLLQLMSVGLMDGVFQDVDNWADIEALAPHPEGTLLRIKETEMNKPVFRLVSKQHQVTDEPIFYYIIWKRLIHLGRAAGFQGRLLSYVLRRGVAYLLASNCTKEERCARMGHKEGDGVPYPAELEEEDISVLSSIALNRRADAPTRLSEEGERSVYNNPEILAATTHEIELLDSLLEEYRTLDEAKAVNPAAVQRYDEACGKTKIVRKLLRAKLFEQEYRAHFNAACPTTTEQATPCAVDSPHGRTERQALSTPLISSTFGEEDQGESLLDRVLEADDSTIDPRLLEGTAEAMQSLLDSNVGASKPDGEVEELPVEGEVEELPARPIVEGRSTQIGQCKVLVAPWTVTDTLSQNLLGHSSSMSRSDIGEMMVEALNHLFISDLFYPGQHPLPGTRTCRFCHSTLPGNEPQYHARSCEKRHKLKQIQHVIMSRYPVPEFCDWSSAKGGHCGRKTFESHYAFYRHLFTGHEIKNVCKFGACFSAIETVDFGSKESFYNHLLAVHGIAITSAKKVENSFTGMLYWCGFCSRWISQLDDDMDAHAFGHLDAANSIIRLGGYAGLELSAKLIQPALCPFCVHNQYLEFGQRFKSPERQESNLSHIATHTQRIADEDFTRCPASVDTADGVQATCDCQESMIKAELIKHLDEAHGLKCVEGKAGTKRVKEAEDAKPKGTGSKKAKVELRRVLQPKSINTELVSVMKSMSSTVAPTSKSTKNGECQSLFVGGENEV